MKKKNLRKVTITLAVALLLSSSFQTSVYATETDMDTTDSKVVDITESEENMEESMDLPQPPNPPILVDYDNLTEEQEALIRQNEENAFTDEEIARMSPEELEKYQLLPLDGELAAPFSTNGIAFYGVATKSVKQLTGYYCGPAATLQTLYTAGVADQVTGSDDAAKQRTLASSSNLRTDADGATWIENIPTVLNKYTGRSRLWTTYKVANNNSGKLELSNKICSNHRYGSATIYLVRTPGIAYYGGTDCNHYITGISIHTDDGTYKDYADMVIIVADPNNDSRYYGNHGIPFEVLAAAMEAYTTLRKAANLVW